MSQISIWPFHKTWFSTCWQSQRSDVSYNWSPGLHTSQEGFCPTPLCRSSLRFWGWCLSTQTFSSLHWFSMGLRAGWLARPLQDLNVLLLEPLLCCLGRVFWVTVMLEYHPWPIFNALAGFNALALLVHGPVHRPFNAVQLSCPLSRKTPPKHNISTSMFDSGDGVLGVIGSIHPPPNTASWVDTKEVDFGLTWQQQFHPVLLWIIGKLQTGQYMCFLEQGTLRALEDFSPSWGSVLPVVFLVTMVSAALRSLRRSSRVVLGWFLTVLMIIETPRGEILHGSSVRGRLIVILYFFHLWIIAPTVVPFSPSCLAMVL